MSDILGHDIDERPLRVGDEVVVVRSGSPCEGAVCSVIGACECGCDGLTISLASHTSTTGYKSAYGSSLRKLQSDHRPADESFSEMSGS